MLRAKAISEEVYVADGPIVQMGTVDIAALKERVASTARKRVRFCAHRDLEERLHEMFVVYQADTYVRPNKHLRKDESLHIIEGEADFIFFDDRGAVVEVVPLGTHGSGRPFYCRIPESVYHTWIIRSESVVVHESIPGPFRRADTVFAPWSPEEGGQSEIEAFMAKVRAEVELWLVAREGGERRTRSRPQTPDVYIAEARFVSVDLGDIEFLKKRVHETPRKRVRLCAHKDTEDRLQEMFIVFARGSYIRPSYHVNKEESMHIVDGAADFVVFDSDGAVREVVPVGDDGTGRRFYCRTPEGEYHTLLIRSEVLAIQETTQGPFRRSDTVFAEWAPADDDVRAVRSYMAQITDRVDDFVRTHGVNNR